MNGYICDVNDNLRLRFSVVRRANGSIPAIYLIERLSVGNSLGANTALGLDSQPPEKNPVFEIVGFRVGRREVLLAVGVVAVALVIFAVSRL